jgi:hypothetical protein
VVAVVAVVVARKSLIYKGFLQPPLFGTMKKAVVVEGKAVVVGGNEVQKMVEATSAASAAVDQTTADHGVSGSCLHVYNCGCLHPRFRASSSGFTYVPKL